MEALPPVIIEKILSGFPAESLLCLKTVCKSWNSIIKTPAFIKRHLNQTLISNSHRRLLKSLKDNSQNRKLSLYSAEIDSDSPTADHRLSFSMLNYPLDEFVHATVFGSCNGVVSIRDHSRTNNVLLYNPFTKSRRILPPEGLPLSYKSERDRRLLYGFGYHSKTEDYKVLRIVQGYSFNEVDGHVCSLYSLNNDCWKSVNWIVSKQFYFLPYPSSDGVLVNENLHYLVMSSTNESMIVCFDLRTESFSLMDLMMSGYCESSLAEFDGCLCVMFMYFTLNYILVRADILVMKEYGDKESWSKVLSISGDQFRVLSCRSFTRVKPVVYSKDRRRILIDIHGAFVTGWFDLETKKFEELERHGLPADQYFMGSLVSVGHNN